MEAWKADAAASLFSYGSPFVVVWFVWNAYIITSLDAIRNTNKTLRPDIQTARCVEKNIDTKYTRW